MANDKSFKIKNGLSATRYLGTNGTETAGSNGPYGTFSTTLYTGDSTNSRQITNGIDLANDGGMVITAPRSNGNFWSVADSERGATSWLYTNGTHAEQTGQDRYGTFNSNGYTLGSSSANAYMNFTGYTYVSWAFKQANNFFDIVTYTGTGSAQNISHNLGAKPGFYLVKQTSGSGGSWYGYHAGLDSTYTNPSGIRLDSSSAAFEANSSLWNLTFPTSTTFSVGTSTGVNASGETYVAYLFAHDTSADGYIQCGSYTGNGSASGPSINLGWQPSWVLIKRAGGVGNWIVVDAKRGIVDGGVEQLLYANTGDYEDVSDIITATSTGFDVTNSWSNVNASGETIIYVAIRAVVPTQTLDLSTGHTFSITPTEATDVLFTNPPASGVATGFTVEVNNSAGGYAITWPSSVKWHLGTTPTATASKEVYTFITTDGGTTYYGKKAGENLA